MSVREAVGVQANPHTVWTQNLEEHSGHRPRAAKTIDVEIGQDPGNWDAITCEGATGSAITGVAVERRVRDGWRYIGREASRTYTALELR